MHQGIGCMCPLVLELGDVEDCLENDKLGLWSWEQYTCLLLCLNLQNKAKKSDTTTNMAIFVGFVYFFRLKIQGLFKHFQESYFENSKTSAVL